MSKDVVCLVPSVFPKQLFGLCLDVIPQISPQGTHVLNTQDLEWGGVSGGVARFLLLSSQVCVKPVLFRRWTQVLRKVPYRRAFGIDKSLLFL